MNKVLIVTGGSRGIGAATARLAAQRGYAVCVNYRRNQAAADALVDCRRGRNRACGWRRRRVGTDVVQAVRDRRRAPRSRWPAW